VRIPHPHCDRPTACMRARPRHIAFCATDTAAHAQRNPRAGTPCKQFSRVPDMGAEHPSVLGHSGKFVPRRLNLRRDDVSEGAVRRAQVGAMASGTSGDHGRLGTSEASLVTTGDNLLVRLPGRRLGDDSGALAPPSSPLRSARCIVPECGTVATRTPRCARACTAAKLACPSPAPGQSPRPPPGWLRACAGVTTASRRCCPSTAAAAAAAPRWAAAPPRRRAPARLPCRPWPPPPQ